MDIKEKLALAHQIISMWRMDDATYTHLSSRDEHKFYISPFGPLFEEVTEKNLIEIKLSPEVKISKDILEKSNSTGLLIHSAIYKALKDIKAVIHLHTTSTILVSSMKSGLLPISQHALHFYGKVSYHKYDSMLLDEKSQAQKLTEDLKLNNVMFLENHGFIACGQTIEEALFYTYHLEKACKIQVLVNRPLDEYILPTDDVCKKACSELLNFEKELGKRDWESWKRKLSRQNTAR